MHVWARWKGPEMWCGPVSIIHLWFDGYGTVWLNMCLINRSIQQKLPHLNWFLIDSLKIPSISRGDLAGFCMGSIPASWVISCHRRGSIVIYRLYSKLSVSEKNHLLRSKPASLLHPTVQHVPAVVKAHIFWHSAESLPLHLFIK